MKTTTFFAIMLLSSFSLFAQKAVNNSISNQDKTFESLFQGENSSVGWFAALQWNYMPIDSKDAYISGIRGGMVINHKFNFGLAFQGINNPNKFEKSINNQTARLESGYGGLILEPVIWNHKILHLTFPVIIGGGEANWISKNRNWNEDDDDWDNKIIESDGYFVCEPGINAEVNLFKHLRLGIGASYKYTQGFKLEKTSRHYLDGFSTGMTLKFGKF